MGFSNAVSPLSRSTAPRRLHASRGRRQYGGVLALVVAPPWPGNLLEGCAVTRFGTEPHLRRSVPCGSRAEKTGASAREPEKEQRGRAPVQRRFRERDQLYAVQRSRGLHDGAPADVRRAIRPERGARHRAGRGPESVAIQGAPRASVVQRVRRGAATGGRVRQGWWPRGDGVQE